MSNLVNEAAVFDALLEGKEVSFDYYYEKFHRKVYANILKLVSDENFAKDILQEVFLAFWNGRGGIKSYLSVPGWLFTTSYNKSMDFLKKRIVETSLFMGNEEFLHALVDMPQVNETFYEKQLQILAEAVNHLPPRKREVYKLCRFEGHTHDYVAAQTGLTVFSVRDYLKQSSRLVRSYIQKKYPEGIILLLLVVAYWEGQR
ncbi:MULTISPECIES: RNA polymerase sigma factor [Chitinophagaceae]